MGLDPVVFGYWRQPRLVIASALVGLGLIAMKRLPEFEPLELQAWFARSACLFLAAAGDLTDVRGRAGAGAGGAGQAVCCLFALALYAAARTAIWAPVRRNRALPGALGAADYPAGGC